MDYLPINLNIKNKPCLVVGGGNVALRKSKQLLNAGAKLSVVSPDFHPELEQLSASQKLVLIKGKYQQEWLNNQLMVVAATDDKETNLAIYTEAERQGILVNVVDQSELCRFIMPSVIDRSPLTIAISSGGSAPVLARMLREKIEWLLPKNIAAFLSKVNNDRHFIAARYTGISDRRIFWERFFEGHLGWSVSDNIANMTPVELNLDYDLDASISDNRSSRVTLIDLGSMQIDDLTIRTIKILQKADSVYLSKNIHKRLRDMIRRDADLHFVDEQNIDLAYLKTLSSQYTKSLSQNAQQIVVMKSGHCFQTDKKACAEIFSSLPDCHYQRIGAINERSPL